MMNLHQRQVAQWLTGWGVQWVEEYPVAGYSIDLYIPELKLGLEIDGPHHSLRRKKDVERDEVLAQQDIKIERLPVTATKDEVWLVVSNA